MCELTKSRGAVSISVEDIQQQIGGHNCGLFAIAYCAALSQNLNPCCLECNQSMIRQALMKCLKSNDILTFLEDIVIYRNRNFQVDIFSKIFIVLHCHCRMPNDGQLIIQCSCCESWFHRKCEKGDVNSKKSNCMSCSEVAQHAEN